MKTKRTDLQKEASLKELKEAENLEDPARHYALYNMCFSRSDKNCAVCNSKDICSNRIEVIKL